MRNLKPFYELSIVQKHRRIKQLKLPPPNLCEICGTLPPVEIGFKHELGEHNDNPNDYQWVCRGCNIRHRVTNLHMKISRQKRVMQPHSDETKLKIALSVSKSTKGKPRPELKGRTPWNKGLTINDPRVKNNIEKRLYTVNAKYYQTIC